MSNKILLHILILFGILFQEIIATFANGDINKSSHFLARQKRVVSYIPGEDKPINIINAPYVVLIKKHQRINCVGTIISAYVAITAASCALIHPGHYTIISDSENLNAGNYHNVTEIRRRIGDPHSRPLDGIGLMVVNPSFQNQFQPIRLHIGPLLVGSLGKVHGWGYNFRGKNQGTNHAIGLRSIEVPIISHRDCVNRYRPHLEISEKNVCTYHPQRHSGHIDFGAGLVVDGYYLAGVFLWSGLIDQIDPRYPDVFVSLQDSYYNQWIRTNVESINLHFRNLHRH